MSRRHNNTQPTQPVPKYWFPFTENANDRMGNFPGWDIANIVGFSEDGGYFNGNSRLLKRSLSIPNSDLTTWGCEIMLPTLFSSGIYTIIKTLYSTTKTENQISYAPGWNQDLNCAPFFNGNWIALSIVSVPFVENRYYKLTIRQTRDGTDLFIDGVKRSHGSVVIPRDQTLTTLSVGYNESNSDRGFKGYIRNARFFDVELTDEQIAEL